MAAKARATSAKTTTIRTASATYIHQLSLTESNRSLDTERSDTMANKKPDDPNLAAQIKPLIDTPAASPTPKK